LYRPDAIVTRLRRRAEAVPRFELRCLSRKRADGARVIQVLGIRGTSCVISTRLIGGRPGTANGARYLLTSTRLWDLLAARYVVILDTVDFRAITRCWDRL